MLPAAIVIGLAVAALTTILARHWWVFDLTTHFRLHYVAVAVLGVLVALSLRERWLALAIIVLAVPHTLMLTSMISAGTAQAAASLPAAAIRVTTINAYWTNRNAAAMVDYVEEADPDILVLQEADRPWQAELLRIGARFPHAVPENWRKAKDVVLFSRFPITDSGRRFADGRDFAYQTADLDIGGRSVTVVAIHTPSPGRADHSHRRNRYFAEIARYAERADHPMIVAGDFNSTVWSPHFADMITASGLKNAADGRGWRPTWPSWLPRGAGIPIDHILLSDEFTVQTLTVGPKIGSDHFPLTADLALR